MKKMFLKIVLVALLGSGLMAGNAIADLIDGTIGFAIAPGSSWVAVDSSGNLASYMLATGIDFAPVGTLNGADFDNAQVINSSGDFSTVLPGTSAMFSDFQFTPSPIAHVTPLWRAGDFWFDLERVLEITRSDSILGIYGTGYVYNVIHGSRFERTAGTFAFTGNTGTWSSTATSPVPEPATMLLFGIGLVGLAGVVRRKT